MALLGSQKAEEFATTDESRFDWKLVFCVLAILTVGIVNVYSATSSGAFADHGGEMSIRQGLWAVVGFGIIGIVMIFDYRLIERLAYAIYAVNLLALAMVKFVGVTRLGARRWLNLGFMSYQPSETMKLAVILALAKFFQSRDSVKSMGIKELIIPGLIIIIPGLLTMAQPDLGTGAHMILTGTIVLLFVGIQRRILLTVMLVGLVSFPIAWNYVFKEYQKDRVRMFIDPTQDAKGKGYNAIQAMVAVGSGELMGKGFLKGTQTQLDFTPEEHTDFIFTVLAEEWGFFGTMVLLALYSYLFNRMVVIASAARDKFGSLVAVGIIGMLAAQITINIAMVTGMFPIVGIPLPLVSYGGTSILTVSLALGFLLNIGYRRTIF